MAKTIQTYTLFIAAPGDIIKEKDTIRDCVSQWNKYIGKHRHTQIEVKDWSDAYPLYGERPQGVINKQIFDESDVVVGLFWTKFGSPTGVADSGTEEEILRAVNSGKHLLLYFNNSDVPLSSVIGSEYQKVQDFKTHHAGKSLYRIYDSVDEFGRIFMENLNDFMHDLLSGKLKTGIIAEEKQKDVEPKKEKDETGTLYLPFRDIENKIRNNFPSYWAKLYGIVEPKSAISEHITFTKNNKEEVKKIKEKVEDWGRQIINYCQPLQEEFKHFDELGADELHNDILRENLWTVGSALDSHDNDLWWFKDSYQKMESFKIKDAVKNIIEAAERYRDKLPTAVTKNNITKPEALGFELLSPDKTLLPGAIGKGIRSEILHKLMPQYFALMTRRSIWALFFLSDEAQEFVVDQTVDNKSKTVHNWDYLYERFTYFNHIVFELIQESLGKQKIKLLPELKYGYTNLFFVDIFKSHRHDIDDLRKLKVVS